MLHNLKKRNSQKGFTIIEVMIVLAIAGLIMLVVFLAVPALQRSSRNTQRKNDTAAIASAIANYIDNNGGTLPQSKGGTAPDLLICGASCSSGNTESAKLGFYDPANVSFQTSATLPTANTNNVVVVLKDTCNTTNTGVNAANSNSRSAAIVYWTETGSGTPPTQCVEQ